MSLVFLDILIVQTNITCAKKNVIAILLNIYFFFKNEHKFYRSPKFGYFAKKPRIVGAKTNNTIQFVKDFFKKKKKKQT